MAGPTYVAAGSRKNDTYYTVGDLYGSVLTIPVPSGVAKGDTVAALVYATTSINTPTGWTLKGSYSTYAKLFTHVVGDGETEWQFTGSILQHATYCVARGADGSAPVPVIGSFGTGSGTSHTVGGLTTPRDNSLLAILAFGAGTVATSFTPPAGWTERHDQVNSATQSGSVDTLAVGSAGAVADVTLTTDLTANGVWVMLCFQPPLPPTITSVTPSSGGLDGGTSVTIEGTGFTADCTVDIGGVAATSVEVVSATSITCQTGANTAGAKTVTVTNSGGSGTLSSGFSYASVVDANIRLFKSGSPTGNDKADAVTQWPASPTYISLGGPDDLWGATLTPDDVNASDFGVGIAATVGSGAEARVSHVEMEVHYTIPGVSDPQTYLAVLKVAADRQTAYPAIYQLPRSGYTVATDPSLDKASSGGSLFTSRIYEPARYIEKSYHTVEFWAELSPENTPAAGLQVWARVEDGTAFQLRTATGVAATLRSSGRHLLYFPRTDVSRGKYVQLEFRIPTLTGDAVATSALINNVVLRFSWRPERTEQHTLPINLGKLPVSGVLESTERRSPYQKLLKLIALAGPGKPPVELRDALGRTQYVFITSVSFEETSYKPPEPSSLIAFVSYRTVAYE